ncbi:MAG: glycosyltransferase family 2 protein [Cyanobacteria bacterium J083]|nr:MAG: glycosyltransferase family 2 protein [Cyanobacteria bacterium J083]
MPPALLERILVVIPVRDEASTIFSVVQSLQSYGLNKIRVIDNGSKDKSASQAEKAGADVLFEPIPGYGQACWRGLENLTEEIEWILFCDGDGSDDLAKIANFCDKTTDFDLIIGNRIATPQGKKVMTPLQHFGNFLATTLIKLGWGYGYHDLGPFRLIRRSALEKIAMQDRGMGWTVEMQIRALELDLRICELPVGYFARKGGKSKISGTLVGSWQAGTTILQTIGNLYIQHLLAKLPQLRQSLTSRAFLAGLMLCLGACLVLPWGDFRQVQAVPNFWFGISIMSLGFVYAWGLKSLTGVWFWLVAIISRVLLIPMYPGDDIWRYLWEGYIQNLGYSPYDFAPNAAELSTYRTAWWSLINHLNVSAIYPPLTQLGFRLLAAISPSVVLFKLAFVLADLAVCWLLVRRFGYLKSILYAWNPLIIYSFAGGGHYDSWFVLPLVAACLIVERQENHKSYFSDKYKYLLIGSLLLGVSIAIKWMSLPILGFLGLIAARKFGLPQALFLLLLGLLPMLVGAIGFCQGGSCQLIPMNSNFVSYGRSAEFIPHFIAMLWPSTKQANSNWLYLFPLAIGWLWLAFKAKNLAEFTADYLFVLLIFSPIIHAWYFTWLIPFGVARENLGIRLISLSSFVYFILPYRLALGHRFWYLTTEQRLILWLPFVFGWLWAIDRQNNSANILRKNKQEKG